MKHLLFSVFIFILSINAVSQSLFKDLSAMQSGDSIFIRWTLLAGNTCFDMQVERAKEDFIFEQIHQVPGLCGATSDLFYSIYDAKQLKSGNFYSYRITGSNGIYISDSFSTNFFSSGQLAFILFPNPIHENLTILLNSEFKPPFQIEMANTDGTVVYRNTFFNQQQEINISNLSDGIYFCKIYADNIFIATKKIVKN